MYETESNTAAETIDQLPADIVRRFREYDSTLTGRTVLPWGEHCTECVWPTCYTTCDLYAPRQDGGCRRFVDGMVRLDCPDSPNAYVLKIRFKRWGKLWTPGNIHLHAVSEAHALEDRDRRIGHTIYRLPMPHPVKQFVTLKRYAYKKQVAQRRPPTDELPTTLLVECYNPSAATIDLSLTIRSATNAPTIIPYQRLLTATPGFHRFRVPVTEIMGVFDLRTPFGIEIIPNEIADDTPLYFGVMDFVAEPAVAPPTVPAKAKKPSAVKCVVWDLDHTMWDGILVEDGASALRVKPGMADLLRALDERGILLSVASKNNPDEAMQVLKDAGLADYFLYPQISWGPKSEGIKAIANRLNIGIDTLLFVDDSPFELAEVATSCPGVRTMSAEHYREILDRPDLQVPVTEESASRRSLYLQDATRQEAAAGFGNDYLQFLRDCGLVLNLRPMTADNLERVHELTQRTNQMNFSGNRYERAMLQDILITPHLATYVLDCEDRFGRYGIIGFAVEDTREPRMTDLMFSCRVQSKRVEHAFLTHLLSSYRRQAPNGDYWANYRKTSRNAPSGRVFEDVGFEEVTEQDGVTSLVFRGSRPVPDDGIVEIRVH